MSLATNKPPQSKSRALAADYTPITDASALSAEVLPDALPDALPEAKHIIAVNFLHPELIAGKSSVSIRKKDCLSIEPAVMATGGRLVPPADGQASSGLLIRRKVSQDNQPREYVARHFVPWANIGHVEFGL